MAITVENRVYANPDDGEPLLARIYRPEGTGPFPAVLEVHGGAWVGGDRLNNVIIAETLAAAGIVVASIDFRIPPRAVYPTTVADVNFGIRWLKAYAREFGSRPDLVGALGTSSGGHLLLLNVLRPADPRYAAIPQPGAVVDASVAFAIVCWPVADPLTRYRVQQERGNERLVTAHEQFWPSVEAMDEGNPQSILTRGEPVRTPPLLIMQGTKDDNLTPDMAIRFADAYGRAGGDVTLEMFPDRPHAFIAADPTGPDSIRALGMMIGFIRQKAS